MKQTLPPRYDFSEVEKKIYALWEKHDCFSSAVDPDGKVVDAKRAKAEPFTIAIPPPNVTGRLHMGHALNNSIQDMLIRYKRMDGYDALWVPGTDHAGIATQTVVKKMLDAEGIDYRELGREQFVKRVWQWKQKYGDLIIHQLQRIGCSCDWNRTRFTMDEGLSRAVNRAFKLLYDKGFIYRGKRIVNWCPVDRTALSDDEVETKDGGEPGALWHIKYPFPDSTEGLVVATTRPETMLGDVAVAVHPEDERYRDYIGKEVILPLQDKPIPVIGDEYVDREFGTGCLKVTPAHDPNDFEVGERHNLEPWNVMNEDATMNDEVPEEFRGLDRYQCRKKVVAKLAELGLLIKEESRMVPVGRSYRSKEVIEYRLSEQWFVKMKPLAEKAIAAHDTLDIQPSRWNRVYMHWLENIRDWCISRQIWWGHRIPAWHHVETGEVLVSETTPEEVEKEPQKWQQDEDVLDTWFSSALWPMSILGWPDETPDMNRYFPTTTLSTAKDIIFFWVARMNFMALQFKGQMPYRHVYIHPTILDAKGETMSKSKGNGVDPLVVIEGGSLEKLKQPILEARPTDTQRRIRDLTSRYPKGYDAVGADALRYTLMFQCSTGQEIKLSLDIFQDVGRRFMTKLWNAARFIFMYIEQEQDKGGKPVADFTKHLGDEDTWIHSKIRLAGAKIRKAFDSYDFSGLGQVYYHLVWNDFCDWYVELTKARLMGDDSAHRKTALHSLITAFADILRLLHPVAPFITEELWSLLLELGDKAELWGDKRPSSDLLIHDVFPSGEIDEHETAPIVDRFGKLQDFVTAVRTLRANYRIKDKEQLRAWTLPLDDTARKFAVDSELSILRLANLERLEVLDSKEQKPKRVVTLIDPSFEIYVDISEHVDVASEMKRIQKEIDKAQKYADSIGKKLANENFVKRAKEEIVEGERVKLAETEEKLARLRKLYREVEQLAAD